MHQLGEPLLRLMRLDIKAQMALPGLQMLIQRHHCSRWSIAQKLPVAFRCCAACRLCNQGALNSHPRSAGAAEPAAA